MREKFSWGISALGKISFQPNKKQMKTLKRSCRISLAKRGKTGNDARVSPTPPRGTRYNMRVGLGDYIVCLLLSSKPGYLMKLKCLLSVAGVTTLHSRNFYSYLLDWWFKNWGWGEKCSYANSFHASSSSLLLLCVFFLAAIHSVTALIIFRCYRVP